MFIWRASNKDQPQVPKHVQVFAARSAAEKKKKLEIKTLTEF